MLCGHYSFHMKRCLSGTIKEHVRINIRASESILEYLEKITKIIELVLYLRIYN